MKAEFTNVLPRVGHVKEAIFILVILIDLGHHRCCRWQNLVYEDIDCLLRSELDPLANHVYELSSAGRWRSNVS